MNCLAGILSIKNSLDKRMRNFVTHCKDQSVKTI